MKNENTFQDASAGYGVWSLPQSMNLPTLSVLTWLSLLGYLIVLAFTQTAYNQAFMNARWIMLGMLAASSTADMMLVTMRGRFRLGLGNTQILAVYLLATFSTVIYAENWIFSGMRWTSHAAMLVVLVLLLPQIINFKQIQMVLFFLKYLMAALVVVSWLFPAPKTILDSGTLYRGIMGNANTMGHIAFIAAFLFLQSFLTSKAPHTRFFNGVFAVAAIITVWESGARSSMIAFSIGVLLLFYYYRKEMTRFILIGILLGSMVTVTFPKLPQELFHFAQKSQEISASFDATKSRMPVWSAAYQGFKKRPLLGWGFGADSDIPKEWEIKMTALGIVERDAVNDFLFMLEGSGIVGLGAYLLLIFVVIRQRPGKLQTSILRNFSRVRDESSGILTLHHAHAVCFILPVCLLFLNQFDNSALSAGNLISVTMWLCVGCATMLRREIS